MDLSLATIVLWAVPVVFAITLHEAAHGYIAMLLGDRTAFMLGRVTLNPLKHIDPVGTIAVPGFLIAVSVLTKAPLFIFGWAKPVPVNFDALRNPKRDMFWVAGAGPTANFVMALAWGILLKATRPDGAFPSDGLLEMSEAGVQVNLMLMALNLLPILPLDGGRIVVSLLPRSLANGYARLEPYGFMVVVALLATGILGVLMRPLLFGGQYAISVLLGL
ncbi:MAG: site-2 protease family protein [Betaproteobacteria bacterium]|jgi:Zn-dependent protease|nr:MAG: site-2 protease family protein [Betaproteobacteria bacterium]